MPLVRSIISLTDGFTVVTTNGASHTITSNDLTPAQKLMTPAQLENVATTFIQTKLQGAEYVGIHLISVVPLQGFICISNSPLDPNWWQQ